MEMDWFDMEEIDARIAQLEADMKTITAVCKQQTMHIEDLRPMETVYRRYHPEDTTRTIIGDEPVDIEQLEKINAR